jgi:hypothetical protein
MESEPFFAYFLVSCEFAFAELLVPYRTYIGCLENVIRCKL